MANITSELQHHTQQNTFMQMETKISPANKLIRVEGCKGLLHHFYPDLHETITCNHLLLLKDFIQTLQRWVLIQTRKLREKRNHRRNLNREQRKKIWTQLMKSMGPNPIMYRNKSNLCKRDMTINRCGFRVRTRTILILN